MKKFKLMFVILLSMSMLVTGCSQNNERLEKNNESIEESVEQSVGHTLKAKSISEDEISDLKSKLEDANFLVKAYRYGVEFALGAEDWVVDSNEVRYYNAKICHGPYSITNKSFGYGVSEDNQAFLEDNYKETLDMFGIDLDSLSAYGMYLMDSYDRLKEPEKEDGNENVFKTILNPKVVVTKETWKQEFPEIINMIEGENYHAFVENENEINMINYDDFKGWLFCFKNFEMYPFYNSSNFKDYYNIKMGYFCDYGKFFDAEQADMDTTQAQMAQQECTSMLEKYGVTYEELEKFSNFALNHYYETDEEIVQDWEEPEFLLIYSGR